MALLGTIVTFLVTNLGETHKAAKRVQCEAAGTALAKRPFTACAAQDRSDMTPGMLARRRRRRWRRCGRGGCQTVSLRNARLARHTLPSIVIVVVVVVMLLLTRCQLRIARGTHCEMQRTDEKTYSLLLL